MPTIGLHIIKGIHQNSVVSVYNQIINQEKDIKKYIDISAGNLLKKYISECNGINNAFVESEDKCEELLLIIDITHENDYSLTEVLYLIELICKLDAQLNNLTVCFWTAGNSEERKLAESKTFSGSDSDYFRLSQILRLWCLSNNKYDNFFFSYFDLEKHKVRRRRLALDVRAQYNSNVLPIVDLSEDIYEVLSSPPDRDDYSELISNYYVSFKENAVGNNLQLSTADIYRMTISQYISTYLIVDQNLFNEWFCEVPTLALLLFIAYASGRPSVDSRMLLELCLSYTRGILQIIENALIHPNPLSESRAFFAFRTHEKTERLSNYIENNSQESILEFIVSDIALKEEYSQGITATFKKEKDIEVSLKDLLEYPRSSSSLKSYFSNHKNLINHYGLPIFSSLVESNGGVFCLTSGGEKYATEYDYNQTNERRLVWKNGSELKTFEGTTYTILLPEFCFEVKTLNYLVNPVISKNSLKNLEPIEFDSIDESVFDSINGDISSKEDDIAILFLQLKKRISKGRNVLALSVKFGLKSPYRIEVFIKAFISLMLEFNSECEHFALEFNNATDLLESSRICGLFYGRMGDCSMLNDESDLLLFINEESVNTSSSSRRAQLYLSGKNITDIVNCLYFQKLNGTSYSALIEQMLYVYKPRIDNSYSITGYQNNDLVMKYRIINKSSGLSLLCEDLKRVLETDVHERSRLGCCLKNSHVQASNVHLDTFYEAHFLFGNAYWSTVFAMFLCEKIMQDIVDNPSDSNELVIYGYEVYSAGVLYKAKEYLEQNEGLRVQLIFLELGDNGEDKNRIRFFEHLKTDVELRVWYFVGISTTLSTFNKMHTIFEEYANSNCRKLKKQDNKTHSYIITHSRALSIIQVGGINGEKNDMSSELIDLNSELRIVSSKVGYLDFLGENNRFAYYYVVVHSTWYKPCECPLCGLVQINEELPLLEDTTKELPLIEVGQTSVTPELLYVPEDIKTPYKKIRPINLERFDRGRYVYCTHMQRGGNHYQYYLRLSLIYSEKRKLIIDWLNNIKSINKSIDVSGKVINLIVSTNDYSHNSFVEDVNQCVFNGTAHTLSFDIKHENRLTFMAKYGYLATFLGTDQHVRWYFVADRIVSGRNFTRAKSLMTSLFSESSSSEFVKTKPNMVFSGIFVLCNQKSLLSIRSLVEPDNNDLLPYFSAIDLHIPSFKSHSGLCPLCQYVDELTKVIDSCSLDCTVEYFSRLKNDHELKDIQETHNYYRKNATDQEYSDNFVRLICEDKIWEIVKRNNPVERMSNEIFHSITKDLANQNSYNQRINRLTIYLDFLSKPYLYTREKVKNITMDLLISLFRDIKDFLFLGLTRQTLNMFYLVPNTQCDKQLLVELFGNVIVYLCAIDSSELLKKDNINYCISEAMHLRDEEKTNIEDLIEEICIGLKLLICQESTKSYSIQEYNKSLPFDDLDRGLNLLLMYKKQNSKSHLLDSIIEKILGSSKHIEIFERIYLENISCNLINPNLIKKLESDVASYLHNNPRSGLAGKYKYLFEHLHFGSETEIFKNAWPCTPELYIRNDSEKGKEAFSISSIEKLEGIDLDAIDENGYEWSDDKTYFFFSISSSSNQEYVKNYRSFKTLIKLDFSKTKLTRLQKLRCIREFLMYRSVILHFLELDFMQDVFNSYYQQRKAIKDLTKLSSTIHGHPLLSGFSKIFNYLLKHNEDEFFSLMGVYANTIISICNRYNLLQTGNGCNLDMPLYITCIDRTQSDVALNAFYTVLKMFQKKENSFIVRKGAEHVELLGKQVKVITLGGCDSEDLYDLAALAYILIKNAIDHGEPPCEVSIIQNKLQNYDLVITNNLKDKDNHKSGITHNSLEFLFEKNPESNCQLIATPNENGKYKCVITNIIGG